MGRIVVGYGEELGRWGSVDAHAEVRWWVANPGGVPLSAWFADSETDRIMRDTFWVGVYPGMTPEMIDYMASVILEGLNQ